MLSFDEPLLMAETKLWLYRIEIVFACVQVRGPRQHS